MTYHPESEQSIDPDIGKMLDLLREAPPRDPNAVARGVSNFMAQVDDLTRQPANIAGGSRVTFIGGNLKLSLRAWIEAFRSRLAFTTIIAVLIFIGLLFGGAGFTAYAAQSSLPGDALYSVKTGLELTQARLSRDASRRAGLYLSFAERRLEEISALITEKRYEDIVTATNEFETYVQRAIETLDIVASGDPARAQELSAQISTALIQYVAILRGMLVEVPDFVKPDVEKAILVARDEGSRQFEIEGILEAISERGWIISGRMVQSTPDTESKGSILIGAKIKVRGYINIDGSLIAIEIEGEGSPIENINSNQNMNSDGDDGDNNPLETGTNNNLNENDGNQGEPSNGNASHNANDNNDENRDADHPGDNQNVNGNSNNNGGDHSQDNDNDDHRGGNDNNGNERGNSNDNDNDQDNSNDNH